MVYFAWETFLLWKEDFYKLYFCIQVENHVENTKLICCILVLRALPIHLKLFSFIFANSAKSKIDLIVKIRTSAFFLRGSSFPVIRVAAVLFERSCSLDDDLLKSVFLHSFSHWHFTLGAELHLLDHPPTINHLLSVLNQVGW